MQINLIETILFEIFVYRIGLVEETEEAEGVEEVVAGKKVLSGIIKMMEDSRKSKFMI
jgi:hypothetical protein